LGKKPAVENYHFSDFALETTYVAESV